MPNAAMDPAQAYVYGTFVQAAYAMFRAGDLAPPVQQMPAGYQLALYLSGVDHAMGKTEPEFFGFVAQSTTTPNDLVVAIRGTDTVLEWLVDAEFKPIACPIGTGSGEVEEGFGRVYGSLAATAPDGSSQDLLAYLRATAPTGPITVVGHSLGASVATLLALDLAVGGLTDGLALYTLASPRTGNGTFANYFDAHVTTSWRVVNAPDLVPKVPPLYVHVATEYAVDSLSIVGAKHSVECYHTLTTYLYLLNPANPTGLGHCGAAAAAAPAPAATA